MNEAMVGIFLSPLWYPFLLFFFCFFPFSFFFFPFFFFPFFFSFFFFFPFLLFFFSSLQTGLLYCHLLEVKERLGELIADFGKTFELAKTQNVPPPLPLRADMHAFDGFYMGSEQVWSRGGKKRGK